MGDPRCLAADLDSPRDVDIPPIPRRALAIVAALCAAAIVVGLTVIAPAIDRSKQRDARARVAAGTLEGTIRSVRCRYRAGESGPPRVYLACLAGSSQTAVLRIGQPFVVAGSLRDGRYAWCHENPRPAEGASGASIVVPLPAACTA